MTTTYALTCAASDAQGAPSDTRMTTVTVVPAYTNSGLSYTIQPPPGWGEEINVATEGSKTVMIVQPTSTDGASVAIRVSGIPLNFSQPLNTFVSGSVDGSGYLWNTLDMYEEHSGKLYSLHAEAKATQWTTYESILKSIMNSFSFTN